MPILIKPTGWYINRCEAWNGERSMPNQHESKLRFLDAAILVIRTKGYEATTIEDICTFARLTKGSFFHHFKSKEELAVAVAEHWGAATGGLFASAPYQVFSDPLDRLLAYIDFRKQLVRGELPEFTCLLGTMVQETYATHTAIRDACARGISGHAATLADDIAQAKALYAPDAKWNADSLALYTQAVIQGAFILGKAKGGPQVVKDCLDHLTRYVELLFNRPRRRAKRLRRARGDGDPRDQRTPASPQAGTG
jgi:TetR/AcrR family transcriptional regulator, transcriptional repressor for nem operon